MKTLKLNSSVTLIQMSIFKTQESDKNEDYDEEEKPLPPG